MRAAICSILELELEEIPSFKDHDKVDTVIQWVYENLGYVMLVTSIPKGWWLFDNKEIYHIRSMNVKHSTYSHAVVCLNGKIVHDPSPEPIEYDGYNHDYFFVNPLKNTDGQYSRIPL